MEHHDNLRLVACVVGGDVEATRAFVTRVASIRKFLASRLEAQRRDDLDDLVQATYCSLWRKLPQYRGEASLETWACSFARLELVRARHRAARQREQTSTELDANLGELALARSAAPCDESPGGESPFGDLPLGDVLAHLTGRVAHVIGLRHVEGLTFREIAGRLAASTSTVKSTYYRGLGRLRERSRSERLAQDRR